VRLLSKYERFKEKLRNNYNFHERRYGVPIE